MSHTITSVDTHRHTQHSFHTLFPSCEVREEQSVDVRKPDESVFHVNTHSLTHTLPHTHQNKWVNSVQQTLQHALPHETSCFHKYCWEFEMLLLFSKGVDIKRQQKPRLRLSATEVPLSTTFNPQLLRWICTALLICLEYYTGVKSAYTEWIKFQNTAQQRREKVYTCHW